MSSIIVFYGRRQLNKCTQPAHIRHKKKRDSTRSYKKKIEGSRINIQRNIFPPYAVKRFHAIPN